MTKPDKAIPRRDALTIIGGGVISAAACTRALAESPGETARVTKRFPSFELQGARASLAGLTAGIAGYSVVRAGPATFAVWLRSKDGSARYVGVDQRDVSPMFEVFTIGITTPDELAELSRDWKAPSLADDVPEPFRTMMMTRPVSPAPPEKFDPWPFSTWRTEVLRRAEFIVEDVRAEGALGNRPNMQSAGRPMSVPIEASASCEVAAGVLFTGSGGRRLLIGVDWMPEHMIVTDVATDIDEYLKPCEAIELSTYLERVAKPA